MSAALFWLLLNFLSIFVLAFYSMMEMACVSFNRIRLHYYVSKGYKRAIWLNELLHNPWMLFGTTLIGVNFAMFFGSEFSREFHSAIGVSPDLAPLTQVVLVIIIGELAPMFAARAFPEHVALLGIPIIYASAKLMSPVLYGISVLYRLCNWVGRGKEESTNIFLSQEELQKILEEEEDMPFPSPTEEFNAVTANIFALKDKTAQLVMTPLNRLTLLPSNATVEQSRPLFQEGDVEYVLIYHSDTYNIVGIAFPSDLIRAPDGRRIRDYARAPWFLTQTTRLMQIVKQFRRNNEVVAVILDSEGHGVGVLDLDDVVEEIFGKWSDKKQKKRDLRKKRLFIIDRSFPAQLKVGDFNAQFDVKLDPREDLTLAELMKEVLGHNPEEGESVCLEPFEMTVKETSIRGIKSITITTKIT